MEGGREVANYNQPDKNLTTASIEQAGRRRSGPQSAASHRVKTRYKDLLVLHPPGCLRSFCPFTRSTSAMFHLRATGSTFQTWRRTEEDANQLQLIHSLRQGPIGPKLGPARTSEVKNEQHGAEEQQGSSSLPTGPDGGSSSAKAGSAPRLSDGPALTPDLGQRGFRRPIPLS